MCFCFSDLGTFLALPHKAMSAEIYFICQTLSYQWDQSNENI